MKKHKGKNMKYKDLPENIKENFTPKDFKPKKIKETINLDEGKITYTKEELLEKIQKLPDDSFITVDSHYDIYDETSELVFEASTERLETEEEITKRIEYKIKKLKRKTKKM